MPTLHIEGVIDIDEEVDDEVVEICAVLGEEGLVQEGANDDDGVVEVNAVRYLSVSTTCQWSLPCQPPRRPSLPGSVNLRAPYGVARDPMVAAPHTLCRIPGTRRGSLGVVVWNRWHHR